MKPIVVLWGTLNVIYLSGCFAAPTYDGLPWTEFAEMLSQIPDTEKYEFVRDRILEGYKLCQQHIDSQEIDDELKLALAIFSLVKKEFPSIEQEKDKRNQICFPAPVGCINSGDAGIRPT